MNVKTISRMIHLLSRPIPEPIKRRIGSSIRLKLVFAFVLCLGAGFLASVVSRVVFAPVTSSFMTTTTPSGSLDSEISNMFSYALSNHIDFGNAQQAEKLLEDNMGNDNQALVVDGDGNVLAKSQGATETKLDLPSVFRYQMESKSGAWDSAPSMYYDVAPVSLGNNKAGYIVVRGNPQPQVTTTTRDNPMALVVGVVTFILLFYFLTRNKMYYIEELAQGLIQISRGNLKVRVEERGEDELASLAAHINQMTQALHTKMEEERRAEQTKNELITNVSHDLRTPLTLIMGYLNLLRDHHYADDAEMQQYIQIAHGKSEKLKGLIDDLFEYTKVSNQGLQLKRETVNVGELLDQLTEELYSLAEAQNVRVRKWLPRDAVMADVDPNQLSRVFENILVNAFKYSYKPGVVDVELKPEQGTVTVTVTNQGDPMDEQELAALFDRFYRVDKARTSASGGSGLGLAIAKGIVDLHGGTIWAESKGREISFHVRLPQRA